MEVAIWVMKAIAGAILSESAKDAYGAVRDRLISGFGMESAVKLLEDNATGETEQKLLAEKLLSSGAVSDAEFRGKVDILVAALKETENASPQAQILIEDVKAGEAEFRDITVDGNASVKIRNVETNGKLTVDNITAKS